MTIFIEYFLWRRVQCEVFRKYTLTSRTDAREAETPIKRPRAPH